MEIIWERLLDGLINGNVIPIIGEELQEITSGKESTTVSHYLAKRLFMKYFPKRDHNNMTLFEVISYLFDNKSPITLTYIGEEEIKHTIEEFLDNENFPIPESFLKLATLSNLKFFLNTTIDDTLERALKLGKKTKVDIINFSLVERFEDIRTSTIEDLTNPTIFNFLGILKKNKNISYSSKDPALSEEAILEVTTSFSPMMKDRAPKILDALKNKQLLFIGCSQPEWLIRFFIRVLANDRYSNWENRENNDTSIIISSNQIISAEYYGTFLKKFNPQIFNGSSLEFIDLLVKKYHEGYIPLPKPKRIFLSYVNEDIEVARKLKMCLEDIPGIKCWFDREQINAGDYFEEKIAGAIRDSDLFIPLISKSCFTSQDRYIRNEWNGALALQPIKNGTGSEESVFTMPVIIDETEISELQKNKDFVFKRQSIELLQNGEPTPKFLTAIKKNLQLSSD